MSDVANGLTASIEFKLGSTEPIIEASRQIGLVAGHLRETEQAAKDTKTAIEAIGNVVLPNVNLKDVGDVSGDGVNKLVTDLGKATTEAREMEEKLRATTSSAKDTERSVEGLAAELNIAAERAEKLVNRAARLNRTLKASAKEAQSFAEAMGLMSQPRESTGGDTDVRFDIDGVTEAHQGVLELNSALNEIRGQNFVISGFDELHAEAMRAQNTVTGLGVEIRQLGSAWPSGGELIPYDGKMAQSSRDALELAQAIRQVIEAMREAQAAQAAMNANVIDSYGWEAGPAIGPGSSGPINAIGSGFSHQMKQIEGAIPIINDAGLSISSMAHQSQNFIQVSEGMAGPYTDLRKGMEGLTWTTHEGVTASQQFSAAQGGVAENTGRAGNSLANQRYALYDVADAYRTVSYAAGAWVAATVGTAVLFEKEFAEVIRTVELTGDSIDDIRGKLVDMSTEMPIAFSELSSIAGLGGQLGIQEDGIESFTEVVAKLGATTDLTTESASFMLGRFHAILGTAPADFERLASAVLSVGVSSNATESEIAKTSVEIAAFAQQAGLTEQQIIALSSTMASGGIPAERARSTIQESFSKMDKAIRDNGIELQRWAHLAGVSVDEFAASWGTEDFFDIFAKSIEGLRAAGEDGSAVLEELGITSQRAVPSLLTLSQMSDQLRRSLGLAEDDWDTTNALMEHYDIVSQTAAAQMIILKNEMQALFSLVGSAVLDSPWFKGIIQIAQDATWAVRYFIDAIPGGAKIAGFISGMVAIAGVMASYRATQALVTAASYAVRDAQSALGQSASQTFGAIRGLTSAVFNKKTAMDQDTVSIHQNTAAAQKNAVTTGSATAALQTETAALTQNVLTRDEHFRKMVTGDAYSKKTSLTQAIRIQHLRLQAAVQDLQTAAQTRANTATVQATKFQRALNVTKAAGVGISNALGAAVMGLGTALKALWRAALPTAALFAGIELLSRGLAKFRDEAKQTTIDLSGLGDTILSDTNAYHEGEEALYTLAIAYDHAGNSAISAIYDINSGVSEMEMATEATQKLNEELGNFDGGVYTSVTSGMKEATEEAGEAIETLVFYLGEAAMQEIWDGLEGTDFKALIAQIKAMELVEKTAEGTAKRLINQFLEGELSAENFADTLDTLNLALLSIPGDEHQYGPKAEDMYATREAVEAARKELEELFGLDFDDLKPFQEVIKGTMEELEEGGTVTEAMSKALENSLFEAVVDATGAMSGLRDGLFSVNEEAEKLEETFHDVMATQMGFAASLYDLGASLFENGVNFDIFSKSGRENMAALDSAMEAAVKNAAGDGRVLVQNMAVLGQALVNNGMEAVEVMELLTKKYAAIQEGGIAGALAAPLIIRTALNQTVPAVNGFRRSLEEGYIDAMKRSRDASKRGAKGMDGVGDSAKDAAKEVRTLADYVSDLSKVFNRSFEFRWGVQQSLDDVADAWQGVHDWAKEAAERIEDAKDEIQDAKDAIRDAKNELKSLSAQMSTLQADESILEYHLRVAIDYGDTLRADQIRAELEENRAKQAEVRAKQDDAGRDVDTSHQDLADATKELADANRDAQKDLSGTTESARDQRDMVWSLLDSYQKQIEAYADTGASAQELEAYTRQLKGEFEEQLRQLGYNQTEVRKYSATFDDLIGVIKNVPRNITVSVDANPALRALEEFRAGLQKTNSSIDTTKSKASGLSSELGGINNSVKTDKARQQLQNLIEKFRPLINRVKEFYDELFKPAPAHGRSIGSMANAGAISGIFNFAKGGLVPDVSGSFGFKPQGTDTVPAMLTPGEFVVPREAVQSLGLPFLEAIRKGQGGTPMTGSTYIHNNAPQVQVVELMPHQFNAMVTAVSSNVGRAMVNGADLSVASARSNQRAVRAGAN